VTTLAQVRNQDLEPFVDLPVPAFGIRGQELSLRQPSLSFAQPAEAMRPFVERYDPEASIAQVFAPVADALDKSGLDTEELDAVLFIGGSAANPIVRTAVMTHLPRTVRAIVPADPRTHVSLGAALHSFGYHAFGFDLIRAVTSEPIFVVARGGPQSRSCSTTRERPWRRRLSKSPPTCSSRWSVSTRPRTTRPTSATPTRALVGRSGPANGLRGPTSGPHRRSRPATSPVTEAERSGKDSSARP